MGDAQVFSQTAIFNLDMAAFFSKWIRDIRDSQTSEGRFPDFAPQAGVFMNFYNAPGWADAGVIVPWKMYLNYGDVVVLEKQYAAMKKFINHVAENNPDLIWRKSVGNMYGDWLNGNTIKDENYPKTGGKVPDEVYSTAFFAYSTRIVSKVAKILLKEGDFQRYDSLANEIRQVFIRNFITPEGIIEGNTQAGYALALDFGLVPDDLKEKVTARMEESVKAYDYRISTGIQSTIRLMNQLSENGHHDIACRLLESRRFPSWLYSIDQGATTIWERWDGYVSGRGFQNPGMNSFNHVAIGAVGEWMIRNMIGLNLVEEYPGYSNFTINPRPGGSLMWAKGSYHSIAGNISVSWKMDTGCFRLDVVVPVNTSADIYLPSGDIRKITESGKPVRKLREFELTGSTSTKTILRIGSGNYSFEVIK
jgi:alpha-L-rhamnosidase